VSVSGYIKVVDQNPFDKCPLSGIKIHGNFGDSQKNLEQIKPNEWTKIKCSIKSTNNDKGLIKFILDDIPEGQEIYFSKFTMKIINKTTFNKDAIHLKIVKNITHNFTFALWFLSINDNAGICAIYDKEWGHGGHDRHIFLRNGKPHVRT
jgi:hypothetical protein